MSPASRLIKNIVLTLKRASVVPSWRLCGGTPNLVFQAPSLPKNCHQHALHRIGLEYLIIPSDCRYGELRHYSAVPTPSPSAGSTPGLHSPEQPMPGSQAVLDAEH